MAEPTDPSALATPEQAMEALMDHLVSPIIPFWESPDDLPSVRQQEEVGKQMHAAVILYNYYHRKQFPSLEFLDYESFFKLASLTIPDLVKYTNYMNRSKTEEEALNNLSITEKTVMEACNVCTALDVSKASPDIQGWPISKVSVFLVDSTKKKCLLHFSSITKGVWAPVEKVLDVPFEKMMEKGKRKKFASIKKRIPGAPSACEYEIEEELEQIALSAVKRETGINPSNLSILERHVTYSLDREKESVRFYIMEYDKVVSNEFSEIPIVDVITRSKGPIVVGGIISAATDVPDFFHILPYVEIIANWTQRKATSRGSLQNIRSDTDEQKMNFQKAKMNPSENETTMLARKGLSSLNELSGSWVELDKLIPMTYQGDLQKGKNENILHKDDNVKEVATNKVKEVDTYKKISDSSMTGSVGAQHPRNIVDEKHSRETIEREIISDTEVGGCSMHGSSGDVNSYKADGSSLNQLCGVTASDGTKELVKKFRGVDQDDEEQKAQESQCSETGSC